ncbi:hypothetical protein A33Q_1396 [Indibacter alkaliphilus LW1]|uniref:Uncharacterized protein n=1 Tax=Indibacter alkaliphilus (strain CCUG 57479 / KCTC 22604 / LW1) TaxID=1189612 RepID=S2DIB6_INDAL|nr:hypothetical protein A33Q_1396 [Indibacter alkaliphilus LW1]
MIQFIKFSSGEIFAEMGPSIMTLIFAGIVFYLDFKASTRTN